MIQYIPFTQKMFSNNLSVNVTSLQSKRGEHEAGTVGHHYPMVCTSMAANHGMQPWRRYLLAFIFYNNSMDAAGAAKLAALSNQI